MKNQANFEKNKPLAAKLLEVFSALQGNARSFDPMVKGTHKVVVLEANETLSKKGKEMKVIRMRSLDDGREVTSYIMKFRKYDWQKWKDVEVGQQLTINLDFNNGFAVVKPIHFGNKIDIPRKPSKPLTKQTILIYDIEIFKKDELYVFRDYFTKEWYVINNDLNALRKFYLEFRDSMFIGFNNASYDNNVMRACLQGKSTYHVSKAVIESDDRGLVYKMYDTNKTPMFGMDLYQDNKGFSLKEHAAFLGVNIMETMVDFDQVEELTEDQKIKNEIYCKNDVIATELRFEQNLPMLLAKATIALMFDLDKSALLLTNANLTAMLLKAVKTRPAEDLTDPLELDSRLEIKTKEIKDAYIGTEFELNEKGKLNVKLEYTDENGYTLVYGSGGLHAAVPSYIHTGRFIMRDFGSLYPNTMEQFDLLSRTIPSEYKDRYGELLQQRMDAKYSTAETANIRGVEVPTWLMVNGIKLPLNTKFGASGAKFNKLYDPRNQFLVCVTGQLIMTNFYELIVDNVDMIQSNTDCHAYIPHSEADEKHVDVVLDDFSKRIGITLDKDIFVQIYQKDVNSYIAVDEKGKVKIKGAIGLTGGMKISKAVVSNAFINYLVAGKDYKEFINECEDLRQFQIITKTGWTFDKTVVLDEENNETEAQKVNRVFAVKDHVKPVRLFKVKEALITCEDDIRDMFEYPDYDEYYDKMDEYTKKVKEINKKVESLIEQYNDNKDDNGKWEMKDYTVGLSSAPEHYAISNEAVGEGIQLEDVDKQYYIDQVEDLLVLWFGVNWKERVEQAHHEYKKLGYKEIGVKNYID